MKNLNGKIVTLICIIVFFFSIAFFLLYEERAIMNSTHPLSPQITYITNGTSGIFMSLGCQLLGVCPGQFLSGFGLVMTIIIMAPISALIFALSRKKQIKKQNTK